MPCDEDARGVRHPAVGSGPSAREIAPRSSHSNFFWAVQSIFPKHAEDQGLTGTWARALVHTGVDVAFESIDHVLDLSDLYAPRMRRASQPWCIKWAAQRQLGQPTDAQTPSPQPLALVLAQRVYAEASHTPIEPTCK